MGDGPWRTCLVLDDDRAFPREDGPRVGGQVVGAIADRQGGRKPSSWRSDLHTSSEWDEMRSAEALE